MTALDTAPSDGASSEALTQPTVIVTSDSHCGPRLQQDLRDYCPEKHLEKFDAYAAPFEAMGDADPGQMLKMIIPIIHGTDWDSDPARAKRIPEWFTRNSYTTGPWNMDQRMREMDRDGIAAEVIFHGGGGGPMPFSNPRAGFAMPTGDLDYEMMGIGYHIYNQWLADWCKNQPERHAGLAYLPLWDVDASVKEVEWARSVGLRGVNFPPPRGDVDYTDPVWDPFWAACQDNDMPLTTHSGATEIPDHGSPAIGRMVHFDMGGWLCRRGMAMLIFGAAFERFPNLKLVLTEVAGGWWSSTMPELDSIHLTVGHITGDGGLKRLPSEYCATNVYIGASFMANFEAEEAVAKGFATNIIWGSDYPHLEGTWQHADDESQYPVTKQQLRYCFSKCPPEDTKLMVGQNGVRVYGFDGPALQKVADRISAPTLEELGTPLEQMPDPYDVGRHSFRTVGPWH
jgi:predicted TIM-barrel fold metal-dependent hydrolase